MFDIHLKVLRDDNNKTLRAPSLCGLLIHQAKSRGSKILCILQEASARNIATLLEKSNELLRGFALGCSRLPT